MTCSICSTPADASDNYCRHCGAAVAVEVPILRESPALPVPWEQVVKPAVARGALALVAGMALELALRHVGKAVAGQPKMTQVAPPAEPAVPARRRGGLQVTETLWVRRITRTD